MVMQTFYLIRKNMYSLKFQTERGRRLKLPWDFNYSFVLLIIYELRCIHSRRRHVAVLKL